MKKEELTQNDEKYLKDIESTVKETVNLFEELGQHAIKVYNDERSEDEPNLYEDILSLLRKLKPDSIPNFEKLIKKAEPDIENKKAIVQQYLITITLVEYLYYIKGKYNLDKLDISTIILGIPYYSDNKVWLNQMSKFVIPTMLKYNLL